jgi:glycerol kinase
MSKYIISLDQGTTSSRAIIFDEKQNIVSIAQKELNQIYPKPGWVEHNPMEIYSTQYSVMTEVLAQSGLSARDIAAIGITNQRETTIVWNKDTGQPIYNAIVWQCRRTAPICEELKTRGYAEMIKDKTGLLIDAYFSGTKIKWILDNVNGAREMARQGKLLFGTVDSWLIWKLTDGKVHVTDYTNASRTMLYNIKNLCWDSEICDILDIPESMLPEVTSSSKVYGYVEIGGARIPIAGCAGDQQAALFGQTCFNSGEAKNTYGTGCFLLMNTGEELCKSDHGLLTTIAATLGDKVNYAIEGSVFIAGAVIQWVRDELRLIQNAEDSEYFANKIESNEGVYIVPAFTGLGAPHWNMYARGTILGLSRNSNRSHIIRAALESIAYQSKDVIDAMEQDTGIKLRELKVDGGASANNFLMQFQSDICDITISRPVVRETTALGAAFLAGLAAGVWQSIDEICSSWVLDREFTPVMTRHYIEAFMKAAQFLKGTLFPFGWIHPAFNPN